MLEPGGSGRGKKHCLYQKETELGSHSPSEGNAKDPDRHWGNKEKKEEIEIKRGKKGGPLYSQKGTEVVTPLDTGHRDVLDNRREVKKGHEIIINPGKQGGLFVL